MSRKSSSSSKSSGSVILLDADDASITVTWPTLTTSSSEGGVKYNLQYRPSTDPADRGIDSGGSQLYTSLSSELTKTTARKRNLTGASHGFWFRVSVAAKKGGRIDKEAMDYITHANPFQVLTMMEQSKRIVAPVARLDAAASSSSSSYVAHVCWSPYGSGGEEDSLLLGYKLQMREIDGGAKWTTVAQCLSGTEVRKKNLTHRGGYHFRVRPVLRGETGGSESTLESGVSEGGNTVPYSKPSDAVAPPRQSSSDASASSSQSSGIAKLFRGLPNDSLLVRGGQESRPLGEVLGGVDLVFLYASAHWCPPCRKFTPQLAKFYNDAKASARSPSRRAKKIEIVFLSADHDTSEFKTYYATMPWAAVPYESGVREKLLAYIKVTGVPRLVVMDARSGKILESNAVGKPLDMTRFSGLLSSK